MRRNSPSGVGSLHLVSFGSGDKRHQRPLNRALEPKTPRAEHRKMLRCARQMIELKFIRWFQLGSRWLQLGSRWFQGGSRVVPGWFQVAQVSGWFQVAPATKAPSSVGATSDAFGCRCWALLMLAPRMYRLEVGDAKPAPRNPFAWRPAPRSSGWACQCRRGTVKFLELDDLP